MIIVDASVVSKWFLLEDSSNAARRFIEQDDELVGPALLILEVLASITKANRTAMIDAQQAVYFTNAWLHYINAGIVEIIDDKADIAAAISVSLEQNHAYQDCLYIALAERLGAALLSDDRKQQRAAIGAGIEVITLST